MAAAGTLAIRPATAEEAAAIRQLVRAQPRMNPTGLDWRNFVVAVLQQFFALDLERATQVMLHVHTRGRGVCGVFTREVAESKVAQVNEFSRMNQHPLLCTMEKA